VRSRTSCKVPDVPALFRRPTEPQPAAFILPSTVEWLALPIAPSNPRKRSTYCE
jgi:hypothetical protein